jgi:ketosteroid isomerase-like protein
MRTSIVLAPALALTFAATVSAHDASTSPSDEAAVKKATDNFYSALNAMFRGDIEPMKNVWSHADDVTYMGPDGTVDVGWNQTIGNLQKQAAMKLGGQIRHEQIMLTIGQDLAIMECREIGENIVDGKPVQVSLRATNSFRKENGQWKLIGHQTDKLPFMDKQ